MKYPTLCISMFVALLSASCGGDGSAGAETEAETSFVAELDSSLSSQKALPVVAVMSLTDEQPLGSSARAPVISQDTPPVVYALDASGEIALAATVEGPSVSFTADSTVASLARLVVAPSVPGASGTTIDQALRAQPAYSEIVALVSTGFKAGSNPLQDTQIQAQFRELASATIIALAETTSSAASRAQPLALPARRLDPDLNPSRALVSVETLKKLAVLLREATSSTIALTNSTPISWTVSIADADGRTRISGRPLEGATGVASLMGWGVEMAPMSKTFSGGFSVKLDFDWNQNIRSLIKNFLGVGGKLLAKSCSEVIAEGALSTDWAKFEQAPTLANFDDTVGVFLLGFADVSDACGGKKLTGLLKILAKLSSLGPDAISAATHISTLAAFNIEKPIDVGVCVDENGEVMTCVAEIQWVEQSRVLLPGITHTLPATFKAANGSRTLRPAALEVQYGWDGASVANYLEGAVQTYKPGRTTIMLRDPATGITSPPLDIVVASPKFERDSYELRVDEQVRLRIIGTNGEGEIYVPLYAPVLTTESGTAAVTWINDERYLVGKSEGQTDLRLKPSILSSENLATASVEVIPNEYEFVEIRVSAEDAVNRFFLVFRNIPAPTNIPTCSEQILTDRSTGVISRSSGCGFVSVTATDGPLTEQVVNGGFYDQIYAVELTITATLPNGATASRSISF